MRRLFILITLFCTTFTTSAQNALTWEKNQTSLRLYGFMGLSTYYDFQNSIPVDDFVTSLIPNDVAENNEQRFAFDPFQTRIGFELSRQLPKSDNKANLLVEVDFRGTANALRLRLAFIEFRGFVAGQSWSFLTDFAAHPPLVDISGGLARPFYRTPLIGYRHNFKELSLGVSLENPVPRVTYNDEVAELNQLVPDLTFYIKRSNAKGHIMLGSVARVMSYGVDNQRINKFGWGVQASGNYQVTKGLNLYAQAIYGEGIGRYLNDMNYISLDLLPSNSDPTLYSALPMWGGHVGFLYLFKEFGVVGVASLAEIKNDPDYQQDNIYQRGLFCGTSFWWTPIECLSAGIGYLYGVKLLMGGDNIPSQRLLTSLVYRF